MTDPVRIGDATLYLGDCLDILPTLGTVDAVVTDPPYGVEYADWDMARPPDRWFDEIKRLAPSCAVHCAQGEMWGWPRPDWVMAWFLPFTTWRTRGNNFRHWEPILVYGKERSRIDAKVITDGPPEKNGHPCTKNDGVTRWLVSTFADAGQTILDPFMGSGTTGVACARLGRKFIGIEIEPKYFDIACKRISREYEQLKLFPPVEKHEAKQMELEP